MIKSFLTQEMLAQGEPALDDYLRSTQTDFNDIKQESFSDLLQDLINQNLKLKRLCTPLVLQESVTKTLAFDSAISGKDYAQRLRLVINVTDLTGNAVFTLQGSDNDGTDYEDMSLIDNNVSSSTSVAITSTGEYSFILTNMFDKYRLRLISVGTTITYSSYLIEEAYTLMHRELTRKKIYASLMANQSDVWDYKFKQYENSYLNMLANTKYSYDTDLSGEIEEEEGNANINQTVSFRP